MCIVDLDHSYAAAVSPLSSLSSLMHHHTCKRTSFSSRAGHKKSMSSVPISSSVELLQVQTSVTNVALEVHPSDQT